MAGQAYSSSSSSSFTYGWTYDVFLSFRGEDTRSGFTGYLYSALCQRGIHTFIDDEELRRGDQITPSLLKAIEESRIAIIVLSEDYASSSFCLGELAKILECIKEKGRLVLRVFYKVDPSEVRNQRERYGEALAKHEERFKDDKEKVHKWRMALLQVANLSGWHFKRGDGYEYKLIERIVKEVSSKIDRAPLHVADYPVGLESRVLKVESLLDTGSDDGVHMVGIHGIGGVGKTALARAIYNLIADQFDGICFLGDVRENSSKHGLEHLQEKLLLGVVGKHIKLGNVNNGITIIKHRLHRKKVLLILDDVDDSKQLQALVGGSDWFGSGSRVIITTRDKHLLARHDVSSAYEVMVLNEEESLELLTWKAFKTNKVDQGNMDILKRVATYASGLPLALEIIGSNLFGKTKEEWESALDQYERIPNKEIQKILKVSFDALDEDEQNIFLDIACFFKGHRLAEIEHLLYAHRGIRPKYGIGVLAEKSLIKIDGHHSHVTLHDLIQDMGREIVRQESPEDPGKRSRLWFFKDIIQVLKNNLGTRKIQTIILDFPDCGEVEWDGKAFKKMENLKTLIIRTGHFSKGPKHLPNTLRVLKWWKYPSPSFPSNFRPDNLAILEVPDSLLTSLEPIKQFGNLKVLTFDDCKGITEIPDVSGVPSLEELSFRCCQNLIKIHDSVGFLSKLKYVDAEYCPLLRTFPPINLTSLEDLKLSYCSSLENFPEILGEMKNILSISLWWSPIKELPLSIQKLSSLGDLSLGECRMCQLPSSIFTLPNLKMILIERLEGCQSLKQGEGDEKVSSMVSSSVEDITLRKCDLSDELLQKFLPPFRYVQRLDLSSGNFTILPACIKECRFLRNLYLDNCKHLQEIRGIPPNLKFFSASNCTSLTSSCASMLLNQELQEAADYEFFCLPGTRIPEWFHHRTNGASISFWVRINTPANGVSFSSWVRNNMPPIAICHLAGPVDGNPTHVEFNLGPTVIINGKRQASVGGYYISCGRNLVTNHVSLFVPGWKRATYKADEAVFENEWNHVEVLCSDYEPHAQLWKECGIHVLKPNNSMHDIRFTNPYKRRKLDDDCGMKNKPLVDMGVYSQAQFMQQQQQLALLPFHGEQGTERASFDLNQASEDIEEINDAGYGASVDAVKDCPAKFQPDVLFTVTDAPLKQADAPLKRVYVRRTKKPVLQVYERRKNRSDGGKSDGPRGEKIRCDGPKGAVNDSNKGDLMILFFSFLAFLIVIFLFLHS